MPFVVENTTRLGHYADLRQHNAVSFTVGKFASSTKFSLQHTDGWQNSSLELYRDKIYANSTTQTVSAYTNERIEQEFSFAPNDRWRFAVSGMYYRKLLQHRPGAPRWRSFNPLYHDQGYSVSAQFKASERAKVLFDADWNRHAYYYDYYLQYIDEFYELSMVGDRLMRVPVHTVYFPGDRSTESDQRRWTAHLRGVFDLGETHRLSVGTEWMRDALLAPHRMMTPRAVANTLAFYAQDEWNIAPSFNVTYGARLVCHEQFGWTATPKISLMYKAGDWNLRASWARGFKAPTIKELYYFYERAMMGKLRIYIGNTGLNPQRSDYFQLGPNTMDAGSLSASRLRTIACAT